MENNIELVAAATGILLAMMDEECEEKKKRKWVSDWVANRDERGAHAQLIRELRNEDPSLYKNFTRMAPEDYDLLLKEVTPLIKKQDTHMRQSISPSERLSVTLRFLATDNSYRDLSYLFRIPIASLSQIIPETCEAIYGFFVLFRLFLSAKGILKNNKRK